jgi:hypothetical protein
MRFHRADRFRRITGPGSKFGRAPVVARPGAKIPHPGIRQKSRIRVDPNEGICYISRPVFVSFQ